MDRFKKMREDIQSEAAGRNKKEVKKPIPKKPVSKAKKK